MNNEMSKSDMILLENAAMLSRAKDIYARNQSGESFASIGRSYSRTGQTMAQSCYRYMRILRKQGVID